MSNRLAENANRNQSHFDYFEEDQEPTTLPINEENQDDRHKRQKEMHLWDVFKQFPSRPKSGSMVDNRGYEVLLQFLKVCVYLVLFLTVLCCSVVSKGTILFATSNINSHYIPFCDADSESNRNSIFGLNISEDVELVADVPESDRIGWIWCIIIAFVVPEFLGMLNAIRVCVFKSIKIEELPCIQNFLFSITVEISHSVGMALLFLVCLPDLNTIQAASIMSCVCFIPSLLAFTESVSKYPRNTGLQNFTLTLADAIAFALQTTGVIASFFFKHKGRSGSAYILPLALVLSSFRWWPNYVLIDEEPMNRLAKIKKDLEPSRPYMQGVTSIIRISAFLATAILITYCKGIILENFFNGFGIKQYVIPVISFSSESNSSSREMILYTDSSVQIHVLIIQIFTSFFAYESSKFACKTLMHRFGFAFPMMLSFPITMTTLMVFCALRNKNICAFHGAIPDYLFFDIPTVKPFEMIFSEWYVWFSILWWLSQIWITSHSWTSTCEKLARAERIFAVPTYDSLIIDQSLPLNRKMTARNKKKHLPLKQDIKNEGNDRLTIIKACATMWHETEDEMSKLVSSILRLDRDNCAMRVVQDHYDVRIPDYYDLETHIFFDDAFQCVHKCVSNCINENETQVNNYVITFVKVVEQSLKKMRMRAKPPEKYPTPFGGRLKWTLPGGTDLIVHLKDKNKIRHKKRWSQVMYMYYLLGYNLMELPIDVERKETIAENTYILTLDGDIDFHPSAVKTLIDLMKRDESLGAACGRIHPIGSGPVIWFQKFEYAIGHWLQKSTEHTIGCVLCSPGCFSLFRGKALMDYNVIRKYATESTEARHYIQYDQGEDRWLCTLILQMGYRVEYSAASDAYTHAPENFDEFYVQRRRWIPSTMANIFDLLSTSAETRRCNNDISWLYMLYQWILMGSTILGPGTIFLMLVGAFVAAFRIDNWTSLSYNLIPIVTFIIVCLTCKEPVQLKVAEIISAVYGLIMGIVLVGIMIQIVEDGWLAPSTLLFFIIAGQMIIAGLLHPREWNCLVCGIIYYITVPSMYMLLIIFAIFNLHNVSWGTRDSKAPDATKPGAEDTREGSAPNSDEKQNNKKDKKNDTKGSIEFSLAGLFKCMLCIHKKESEEEIKLNNIAGMLSRIEARIDTIERKVGKESTPSVMDSVNSFVNEKESTVYKSEKQSADYKSEKDTVFSVAGSSTFKSDYKSYLKSEDSDYSEPESISESRIYSGSERDETDFVVNPAWMFDTELGKGGVSYLVTEEETFWIDVIAAYLKPIVLDEETREKNAKVAKDLKSLRDKYLFQFCMVNALFVIMVFLMQLNKDKLHFVWPFGATYNITYEFNNEEDKAEVHIEKHYLRLEPIGCLFIITFVSIFFIQFLAMLVHRFDTFSHLLAKTSLDWYCCKKATALPNEAIIVRYRDIFSKYVQTAYDKMIRDGENRSRKSPGSRKTLPDLMERRESSIMESFESLFHEYLDRPDLAEKSGKLTRPVIEAMKHRSTLHRNQQRNKEDTIYDNANNLQKTVAREQPRSRRSGYDNDGFDSD